MSSKVDHEFSWGGNDEPHAVRRRQILAKYPKIAELSQMTEPLTFAVTALFFAVQMLMVYLTKDASWGVMLLCSYVVGGTINHSLQLASHELSHNLCWSSPAANKLSAIFANLATGFPSAITFQRYHMDHHAYQGVDGVDTDVPTLFEARWFRSTPAKVLWLLLNPIWYSFRPLFMKPKPFIMWEGINWAAQIAFDIAVMKVAGVQGFCYLWMGSLLGLGLHPAAGHFIAEHYELSKGYETYSYYGVWNLINFNVGYHNEHHDFPRVPWTKLPLVKQMAPEFYNDRPCYDSYLVVMWKFLTDPTVGPWSRIKRKATADLLNDADPAAKDRRTKQQQQQGYFKYVAAAAMASVILFGIGFTIKKLFL